MRTSSWIIMILLGSSLLEKFIISKALFLLWWLTVLFGEKIVASFLSVYRENSTPTVMSSDVTFCCLIMEGYSSCPLLDSFAIFAKNQQMFVKQIMQAYELEDLFCPSLLKILLFNTNNFNTWLVASLWLTNDSWYFMGHPSIVKVSKAYHILIFFKLSPRGEDSPPEYISNKSYQQSLGDARGEKIQPQSGVDFLVLLFKTVRPKSEVRDYGAGYIIGREVLTSKSHSITGVPNFLQN